MNDRSVAAWGLVLLPVAIYIAWCVFGFNRLGQAPSNIPQDPPVSCPASVTQPMINPGPDSVTCNDNDACVAMTTIPAADADRVGSPDQLRLLLHR